MYIDHYSWINNFYTNFLNITHWFLTKIQVITQAIQVTYVMHSFSWKSTQKSFLVCFDKRDLSL